MANKFYQSGERRAANVGDLFATIAPRYDFINDLQSLGMHRRWKRKLVEMADARPGSRVLDLCCGTGDVSFALAATGAEVVALDFSAAMLDVANRRKRASTRAPERVTFLQADAQNIPFPDAHFDAVTVAYGLRNLSSFERGLEEMHRVIKPGGRLLVLDFGKPENRLWRAFYFAYLRLLVPVFGKLFCGDPELYAYIYESLQHYPAQRGVAEKVRAMNCTNVRIIPFLGGAMAINYAEKAH